ncbi:MAG TPA: DNA repair protein RadA [Mycobacteriales bacterium]
MPAARAVKPSYRCAECGATAARWLGRCPECQAWGTLEEVGAPRARTVTPVAASVPARPIADVDGEAAHARATGVGELDRVLGGGLVPGAVVLLAGEPGVGKSTLLLEVAHRAATAGAPALIVSGEESAAQVRLRAGRMGALSPHLYLAAETDLSALLGHVDAVRPGLLVVDSVQTLTHPDVDGAPGGVTQVREVASALIRVAKERGLPTVLVGHVTKDGSVAGPRVLEHLVDVVLSFEGERQSGLRLVRAVKNRYGATDEVGCFQLTERGIEGLPDPSGLFLSGDAGSTPGTAVTVALEGRRALVCEVQALLVASQQAVPRRAVSGLDAARVAMLLAVLERRAAWQVGGLEVYASTVGGVRLVDPGADLALLLALAGARRDTALPARTVAIGEVGLAGEVRPVPRLSQRLAEATRLGFAQALVPAGGEQPSVPAGMRATPVSHVAEALRHLGALRPD